MRSNYHQPFAVANPRVPTIICGCFGDVAGGIEAAEANAALIACAPELLTALKDMVRLFGNQKRDEWLNDEAFKLAVTVTENAKNVLAALAVESKGGAK